MEGLGRGNTGRNVQQLEIGRLCVCGDEWAAFPEFQSSLFEFGPFSLQVSVDCRVLASFYEHADCFSGSLGFFESAYY